jgi:hypothetical protein|uniref:Uncharacterized protein n=1 Tax=uncultured haloarchaeon TaxID=160804 RepID=A5YS48_9EURY|nr:hypothetical protein [uncultured haloarchaeon]
MLHLANYMNSYGVRTILDTWTKPKPINPQFTTFIEPQTTHYAFIGRAFKYLFAIWNLKHNLNTIVDIWKYNTELSKINDNNDTLNYASYIDTFETLKTIEIQSLDPPTNKLLDSVVQLTALETLHTKTTIETSVIHSWIESPPKSFISELYSLYTQIPETINIDTQTTICPRLGLLETQIGAIQIDAVHDSTAVVLKTTQQIELTREYWRTLIGYLAILEYAYEFDSRFSINAITYDSIEFIGVYYSRHGVLWRVSKKQITRHSEYSTFKNWLIDSLKRKQATQSSM